MPADMNWRMAICDYVRDSRRKGERKVPEQWRLGRLRAVGK